MYTRASSRDGKSIALPHLGQLKRAWTGGILAREIVKVPAQIGQVKPYLRSASVNGISSKRDFDLSTRTPFVPRPRVASVPMTPLALARRLVDRLRGTPPRPGGLRGVGHDWEREAERALVAARYRILERNFR